MVVLLLLHKSVLTRAFSSATVIIFDNIKKNSNGKKGGSPGFLEKGCRLYTLLEHTSGYSVKKHC